MMEVGMGVQCKALYFVQIRLVEGGGSVYNEASFGGKAGIMAWGVSGIPKLPLVMSIT